MNLRSRQFSTIAAAVVIAFFSIYAVTVSTFNTWNHTNQAVTVSLHLQSGAIQDVTVAPGQSLPVTLDNDAVMSMVVYGAMVPAGANAIVPNPTGGTVKVFWMVQHNADGSTNVVGGGIDPDVVN
jgi:hypothetical protein